MFSPVTSDSSSSTNVLTSFVTVVLAISITDERLIEAVKEWWPNLPIFTAKTDAKRESHRNAEIHLIAALVGVLIAWVSRVDLFKNLPLALWSTGKIPDPSWHSSYWAASWIATGILASAGSAFWNHTLDLLKASKVEKEQTAISTFAANKQKGLVDAAHPNAYAFADQVTSPRQCRATPGAVVVVKASQTPLSCLLYQAPPGTQITAASCLDKATGKKTAIDPVSGGQSFQLPIEQPGNYIVNAVLNRVNGPPLVNIVEDCPDHTHLLGIADKTANFDLQVI